jgi:hypothetical protein
MAEKTESTVATGKAQAVEDRAAGLSEELLTSIESINNAALEAAHKFVDTVEGALPTERGTVIGAAVDLADRLVTKQHEFVRSILRSTEQAARKSGGEQKSTTASSDS